MARINLLPWREEQRRRRQQEFMALLGMTALAAVVVAGLVWFWYGGRIDDQMERNQTLRQEIQRLDTRIAEIERLEATRDQLLTRKEIIEELQSSRSLTVEMLDELARATPVGVTLGSIRQQGMQVTMEGSTQSNARVSAFLQNLENSAVFADPTLQIVEARRAESTVEPFDFRVRVNVRPPQSEDDLEDEFEDEFEDQPGDETPAEAAQEAAA